MGNDNKSMHEITVLKESLSSVAEGSNLYVFLNDINCGMGGFLRHAG